MADLETTIRSLREACDNYQQTILALKAFAHEMLWDDQSREIKRNFVCFGRRMDTSKQNVHLPSRQVTPDLVVQPSSSLGIIAEAKASLPFDENRQRQSIQQVQRYDDDLIGWQTEDERIPIHDIVLLVHHFRGQAVSDLIRRLINDGVLQLQRCFSLVAFALVEQTETWMSLELVLGNMTDKSKEQKLRGRLPIRLDHVVGNELFANIELYDAKPPDPLLMKQAYYYIFSSLSREEHFELEEKNEVQKEIDVKELRLALSECYGPGQAGRRIPQIPKKSWVEDALKLSVTLGWARELGRDKYTYIVKRRRNVMEQFIRLCAKIEVKSQENREKPEQLQLL